ncbi:MAG TPA: hypothetical protein VFL88_08975 [Gemmatimonadales bacterium]|nr:hypothetical protein [Gemmatimonadales bacterium]
MYLIRLASGEERTFATIDDLAAAVQRGEVQHDATIFHRRTRQWLPLEHHPYFAFATGEYKSPSAPEPPAREPERPPARDADPTGTGSLLQEEERLHGTPSNVTPLRPEPPAKPATPAQPEPPSPSPLRKQGRAAEAPPPPAQRYEPVAPTPLQAPRPIAASEVESRASRVERHQPSRRATEPPSSERRSALDSRPSTAPPSRRRTGLVIAVIVILGSAIGILVGLKLRNASPDLAAEGGATFRPAPPPSALLDDTAAQQGSVHRNQPAASPAAARVDPTAPATAEQLMQRRHQSYLNVQAQLGRDLAAVDFNGIFGVRALSTPDGARAARRVVASALNVLGQFHRREVMTDRAYEDTASFQATQAGWTRDQIAAWDHRATLKEPYQSADLAESLLADADSLLNILGSSAQWSVEGDSLRFPDSSRAAAYQAQRARLVERAGPPVTDTVARPALAYVRGAVNPELLPK